MASFQAKIGWKTQRKRENKNCRSISFLMASFQAKIGWKRQRKRENKNYRSILFHPDGQGKIPKKQQKNSKN